MLEYDRLSEQLIKVVPEIRIPYETELRVWRTDVPGQHIIFGDLLAPFLVAELERGKRKKLLRRIFDLLEEMATDPDVLVQEVAQQAVLSNLCGQQPWSSRLDRYLGPRSRALMLEYCDGFHKRH